MEIFLQVFVSGIATGCIYGLVALSFVMIYKSTGVVSFMQGELLMCGAFAALALNRVAGWPLYLSVLVAVFSMVLLGAVLERTILRRAIGQPHLTAILLTFGLGMVLHGGVASVPSASRSAYRLVFPFDGEALHFGILTVALEHVYVIGATLLLVVALGFLFRCTRIGLALRACSQDSAMTGLMGISLPALYTLVWAMGAGLATLAGVLLAPVTFVHLDMGGVALKAFPAAVLGGMTSLPGALLAGICLGVAEALAGLMLPEGGKDAMPYVLLMAALLLFPQGLSGHFTKSALR